jgi:hypothetical protein
VISLRIPSKILLCFTNSESKKAKKQKTNNRQPKSRKNVFGFLGNKKSH